MSLKNSQINPGGNFSSSTPKAPKKVSAKCEDETSDEGQESDDEFDTLARLPDVFVEPTEGKLSENSKSQGRKIYKKKHYCSYCNVRQEQIIRHCILKHAQMPEVKKVIQAGKNNDVKSKLTTCLKNRGNFLHNLAILKEKKGNLVVVRRPDDDQSDASRYLPCPHCMGFFSKYDLWRHKCVNNEKPKMLHSLTRESRILLQSALEKDNTELEKVLNKMKNDDVTAVAKADRLIRKFMNDQLELHDNKKPHLVRGKGRDLARFLIHLRKYNSDLVNCDLEDVLVPSKFDLIAESVKNLAIEGDKDAASLPLKLGQYIQHLIAILIGESIRNGDDGLKDRCERFNKLYDSDWSRKVSLKARRKLYNRRLNKSDVIPEREDVVQFAKLLYQESNKCEKAFIMAPGKVTGRKLSEAVLMEVVTFNKRRGGEAARLEVKVYKEAVERWKNINFNSELFYSLPEDQKRAARNHFRCQTIGKKGRHVPILMTLRMKCKVDLLVEYRKKIGQTDQNKYVFGIPGHDSHLRSWEILRSMCMKFEVGNLTSTSLRRYLACGVDGTKRAGRIRTPDAKLEHLQALA